MSHWATNYISPNATARWEPGGRGPVGFDCWGLARWIQRKEFNRPWLPVHPIPCGHKLLISEAIEGAVRQEEWVKLEKPVEGCMVPMSHGQNFHHIGVWTDAQRGMVIHIMDGKGVLAQSLNRLRNDSWGRIEFYLNKSWITNPQT